VEGEEAMRSILVATLLLIPLALTGGVESDQAVREG